MRKLVIFNGIALAIVLYVNYLSVALPINGQTPGEISDRINVLLTPAGYVFSIWGLIYLLLGLWIVATWISPIGPKIAEHVRYLFIINAGLNIAWIYAFHYEYFILSLIIIVALLWTTFNIYQNLSSSSLSRLWQIPFSIYLAWVTIATILNVGIVLKTNNISFYVNYEIQWTLLLLILLTVFAIWFSRNMNDLIYPLVFVWAFVGVAVKRAGEYQNIVVLAIMMAILIIVYILYIIVKKKLIKVV